MATRAMDPTLARNALLVAGLLCAVPSVAVAVFAFRDAPPSAHAAARRSSGSDEERRTAASARTTEYARSVTAGNAGRSRFETAPRAPGETSGGQDVPLNQRSALGPAESEAGVDDDETVAASAGSSPYAERIRRFEDELAKGQSRPDFVAAVEAQLAERATAFLALGQTAQRASSTSIRCTDSVCELALGLGVAPFGRGASPADAAFPDGKSPAREAGGPAPWKRVSRVYVDTSTLDATSAGAAPAGGGDVNAGSAAPDAAAIPAGPQSPLGEQGAPGGAVEAAPTDAASVELPAGQPAATE